MLIFLTLQAIIVLICFVDQAVAFLEQSAFKISEFGHGGIPLDTSYLGSLTDRYEVLRVPTYWTSGCEQNWRYKEDILFKVELPGMPQGFTSYTIEFEWDKEVIVGEVFFLLTNESAQGLYIRIEMKDSGGVCELNRSTLATGYHSCDQQIKGKKLTIRIMSNRKEAQKIMIAAINIFSTKNQITDSRSDLILRSDSS